MQVICQRVLTWHDHSGTGAGGEDMEERALDGWRSAQAGEAREEGKA